MKSLRVFARSFAAQAKKIYADPATWIVVNAVFLASHAAALGKSLDDWWWRVPMAFLHLAYLAWASRLVTRASKPRRAERRTPKREQEPRREEYGIGYVEDENGNRTGPGQAYLIARGTVRLLTRSEIDDLLATVDPEDTDTLNRLLDARVYAPLHSEEQQLQGERDSGRETGRETNEEGKK